ncbi:alpha/beta hydrolase family protein [Acetobacter sp.]|jgi:dienelactone hydrolase|uniref:alpha/beta hydrolase family protein n=1 Tax=Acetobacter sp. TaxID=440 RepID=UPI0025C475A9|nr:CocE/NonD family hydrolase [Acetobacter sp.]MCH4090746.1 dienelactone hydrolase [Acetobacter sp.]MCI1300538.1 dienelactone hydrolase [Acetobacter sp.]MCI1316260.1 dienelactone hydrolase [Acetobacter sp.]
MHRYVVSSLAITAAMSFTVSALHAAPIAPLSETETTLSEHHKAFSEQFFRLPARDGTILEATLLLPHTTAPFPLAIVSGGASHISSSNHGPRDRYSYLSGYFLARGYAVLRPMPRGFAGSEGHLISDGCEVTTTARRNADDIRYVSASILQLPDIDASRIVTAGVSFGGWVQMAMGTMPLPGTRAQFLFFPLMQISSCHNDGDRLLAGASEFGAETRLPTLWVQGENDSLATTEAWKARYAAYKEKNPRAELVDVPPFLNDSHSLLNDPDGLRPWMAQADAMLEQAGLPYRVVIADYLPALPPPASGYAELNDFSRLPARNDMMRKAYQAFLAQETPRAFVVGDDAESVGAHSADPIASALSACGKASGNCHLYAYDNRVVWQGHAASQASQQTISVQAGKIVSVFYSALNMDCSARYVPAIRLVKGPVHGALRMSTSATGVAHHAVGPLTKCNTIPVRGSVLQYRSNPDFHGTDSVTITKQVSTDPSDLPVTLTYLFTIN